MRKVDLTIMQDLAAGIEALPAREELRAYEAIVQLAPAIEHARARGQRIDTIVEKLNAAGVQLKRSTVLRYLSLARRADPQGPAGTPTIPTVSQPMAARPASRHPAPFKNDLEGSREEVVETQELAPGHFLLIPDTKNI